MSILTKILVVLLSIFSILLCGMIVTFVGNTNNYKAGLENEKHTTSVLQADNATKTELFNAQVKKTEELQKKYDTDLQAIEGERNNLMADLRTAQRLAQQYQAQSDSWKGVLGGFEQSVRNLQASLSQTQQQLDQARAQGIKDQKDLNQITADLYEKIVQVQSMEAERRRLLEQKTELEKQIASSPTRTAAVQPVTPLRGAAVPAQPSGAGMDIKGLVVGVDRNMATLSVGSADGVKEGTVLHVTRGDRFLCDVVVTNVDINQSAGVLELVQQAPQSGDTVSTQL
ncbi:MAG: HlyD family secretion protein [Planctomycetaceae bacterium]|nr:HlyD family secretion protein [Planctomycetaceae bacterium]